MFQKMDFTINGSHTFRSVRIKAVTLPTFIRNSIALLQILNKFIISLISVFRFYQENCDLKDFPIYFTRACQSKKNLLNPDFRFEIREQEIDDKLYILDLMKNRGRNP